MEDKRTWDCVKKPLQAIIPQDSAPKDIFGSALGSSRRPPPPPTSPSNVVAKKKSTQFHPFCSKFNFVWGGRGGVASFSNITGKVPTLLTSIEVHVRTHDRIQPHCDTMQHVSYIRCTPVAANQLTNNETVTFHSHLGKLKHSPHRTVKRTRTLQIKKDNNFNEY